MFFGMALMARVVLYLGTTVFGTDGGQFLYMADWMSQGRFHEALSITYHPLYPLIVAAAKSFFASTEQAGFWVSIVLGAGSVAPLFLLVNAIFGRPAAFITALMYCFHPHIVELHADVMSEATFAFFLFWSAWLCWKGLEEPSLELSLLAGMAAVAAYLTRPEGMLAVALVLLWPLAELLRRRDRAALRLGGLAACGMIMLLLAFPFLLWVRSVTGRWEISAKTSVLVAGKALTNPDSLPYDAGRYGKFVQSVGRMTYLVTLPLYLLGLWALKGVGRRGALFYFSFPLGYFAGLLLSMRTVGHTSLRYVVPGMAMLSVLAALGAVDVIRRLARRWPEPRWTLVSQAMVALISVGVSVKCFMPQRTEQAAVCEAAQWIRAQGPGARVYSTIDKVGYLSGAKLAGFNGEWGGFLKDVARDPATWFVYLDKDLDHRSPDYLGRLAESDLVRPPVVFPDPPRKGVWKVFVHPAR